MSRAIAETMPCVKVSHPCPCTDSAVVYIPMCSVTFSMVNAMVRGCPEAGEGPKNN